MFEQHLNIICNANGIVECRRRRCRHQQQQQWHSDETIVHAGGIVQDCCKLCRHLDDKKPPLNIWIAKQRPGQCCWWCRPTATMVMVVVVWCNLPKTQADINHNWLIDYGKLVSTTLRDPTPKHKHLHNWFCWQHVLLYFTNGWWSATLDDLIFGYDEGGWQLFEQLHMEETTGVLY